MAYSVHGRVTGKLTSARFLGSGTIIGTRYVLTAAHNVYDRKSNQEVDVGTLRFIPAMSGESRPYGEYSVLKVFYPEEFKSNREEDYAVLVLDQEVASHTGFFKLNQFSREQLNGRVAGLYGYPVNMMDREPNHDFLFGAEGPIQVDMNSDMIVHFIDTSPGIAGAAVFVEESNEYYVVGVHVKGSLESNIAVYMNEARVRRIESWINSS